MEARQADAAGYFPTFFVGTFIKALRRAHPGLRRKHLNLPYGLVGTFPKTSPLRSQTHHSPGTELFLFRRAGSSQTKTPAAGPTHRVLPASSMNPIRKTQHADPAS